MQIQSETLALWFLRLNGFLTIPNFVVHPEGPDGGQGTEVDVLGVRFPNRCENRARPMRDFALFGEEPRLQVVLSEIKKGKCKLNGPWTSPQRHNMQKVLFAGGFVLADQVEEVAASLYAQGVWESQDKVVRILCFGDAHSRGVERSFPEVPQLIWTEEVLRFVHRRFWEYRLEKRLHEQWDESAKELFLAASASEGDAIAFINSVEVT